MENGKGRKVSYPPEPMIRTGALVEAMLASVGFWNDGYQADRCLPRVWFGLLDETHERDLIVAELEKL